MGPIDVAGVKVVGDFEQNYRMGLPSELALITLYRCDTGAPFAIVDGTLITWMRTGAVTAVGAKYLACRRPRVLGHVGVRGTAWYNVPMLGASSGTTRDRRRRCWAWGSMTASRQSSGHPRLVRGMAWPWRPCSRSGEPM